MGLLQQRQCVPEIMDQPGLEPGQHHHALRGLSRINLLSGSAGILWPPLRDLAVGLARPLRVLDLASGGGDIPLRLWCRAQSRGLSVVVDGCDISPVAVEHARAAAARAGAACRFFVLDALRDPLPEGYDAIVCSLFLHHLDDDEAVSLLGRMAEAARHLVLVNDLARSEMGLILAAVATRLLTTSAVVHVDGPRSVRRAFTPAEALQLARRAGLASATAGRRWPCRFLLAWRRS
jgi:SAM-dependent methyltransferase